MIYRFVWIILIFLFLTIIVEGSLAFILKRRGRELLIVVLANLVTNPIVQSVSYILTLYHGRRGVYIGLAICEIWAVLTEGFIYSKSLKKRKLNPYLLSLVLNVTSYCMGLVIEFFYKR